MSKSNTRYIATVAFAQAISQIMAAHYSKKPGRKKFKDMILKLYAICDNIIVNHTEKLSKKEANHVEKAVKVMNEHGLENAKSYKTYISFLIAIVNERITELSKSKKKSPKVTKLDTINDQLILMYEYFEQRLKNNEYDVDAMKLLNNFNLLF